MSYVSWAVDSSGRLGSTVETSAFGKQKIFVPIQQMDRATTNLTVDDCSFSILETSVAVGAGGFGGLDRWDDVLAVAVEIRHV